MGLGRKKKSHLCVCGSVVCKKKKNSGTLWYHSQGPFWVAQGVTFCNLQSSPSSRRNSGGDRTGINDKWFSATLTLTISFFCPPNIPVRHHPSFVATTVKTVTVLAHSQRLTRNDIDLIEVRLISIDVVKSSF